MKKTFDVEYISSLGLPDECDGGEVISDRITNQGRWSTHHEVIFRLPDQSPGEAWRTRYSVGSTEGQYEGPWEYDEEVECTLVREVERLVKVWEPVRDPAVPS